MSKQKIVVKIGSNVITRDNGEVNTELLQALCAQLANLRQLGFCPLLVSSGAVAAGRGRFRMEKKTDPITQRQLLAAVGQTHLMNTYSRILMKHQLTCAQVLVTKEDFRDRRHYLNMRNCLEGMLSHEVIPIINENDVVSVTELMFTDNDELAGLVAAMVDAQILLILTNVEGIYDRNPKDPEAYLLKEVDNSVDLSQIVTMEKSDFGRGGMLTKAAMAQKLSDMGIRVHIAGGQVEKVIERIVLGEEIGTRFVPDKKVKGVKRWLGHAAGYASGTVYVNTGAKKALLNSTQATSLLPIGIIRIEGDFERNDIVHLKDEAGKSFGLGKAQYNATQARELMGNQGQKPLVHYDYLYLFS
ncbi:glutamate 5-kinase [Catalinimonas niigatensis]|uniref:glutamate 5-kinase n=1 Tax=Catalinimonas niigatensis TaxID=1397264 RepID=UPI0026662C60|nr:glutamate 5-kinase [Catalinimonas niigatensis]WPP49996.1 glutamate 5-kinase [Catalinimonas niigatensis]